MKALGRSTLIVSLIMSIVGFIVAFLPWLIPKVFYPFSKGILFGLSAMTFLLHVADMVRSRAFEKELRRQRRERQRALHDSITSRIFKN